MSKYNGAPTVVKILVFKGLKCNPILLNSSTGAFIIKINSFAVLAYTKTWGGVQLAVDTTLVSALDASGRPRRHQRRTLGAALRIACLAKERTYPELIRAQRCRLVVLAIEVAGRLFSSSVAAGRGLHQRTSVPVVPAPVHSGGRAFSLSRPPVPLLPHSILLPCMAQPTSMARSPPSAISSPKSATGQTALSPAASLRGGERPPARPAGRVSWTFPTLCGQPAVSFGLGLRTRTAWIGLKKVRQKKECHPHISHLSVFLGHRHASLVWTIWLSSSEMHVPSLR